MSSKNDVVKMGINVDNAQHIMNMLSSLYSLPVYAVIREYVANSIDAVRANGGKVELILPSRQSPQITVVDTGEGMSKSMLMTRFSVFGDSMKTYDGEAVGGFGVGSKSGLSISDEFYIESVKDGYKNIITLNKVSGAITFDNDLEFGIPTSRPSGTAVVVPYSGNVNIFDDYDLEFFRKGYSVNDDMMTVFTGSRLDIPKTKIQHLGGHFPTTPYFGFSKENFSIRGKEFINYEDVLVYEEEGLKILNFRPEGYRYGRNSNDETKILISVGGIYYRWNFDFESTSISKEAKKFVLMMTKFSLTPVLDFLPKKISLAPSRDDIIIEDGNKGFIEEAINRLFVRKSIPYENILSVSPFENIDVLREVYGIFLVSKDERIETIRSLVNKYTFKNELMSINNISSYVPIVGANGRTTHSSRPRNGITVTIDPSNFNEEYIKSVRAQTTHSNLVTFVKVGSSRNLSDPFINSDERERKLMDLYIYGRSSASSHDGSLHVYTEDEYISKFKTVKSSSSKTNSLMLNIYSNPLSLVNEKPRRKNVGKTLGKSDIVIVVPDSVNKEQLLQLSILKTQDFPSYIAYSDYNNDEKRQRDEGHVVVSNAIKESSPSFDLFNYNPFTGTVIESAIDATEHDVFMTIDMYTKNMSYSKLLQGIHSYKKSKVISMIDILFGGIKDGSIYVRREVSGIYFVRESELSSFESQAEGLGLSYKMIDFRGLFSNLSQVVDMMYEYSYSYQRYMRLKNLSSAVVEYTEDKTDSRYKNRVVEVVYGKAEQMIKLKSLDIGVNMPELTSDELIEAIVLRETYRGSRDKVKFINWSNVDDIVSNIDDVALSVMIEEEKLNQYASELFKQILEVNVVEVDKDSVETISEVIDADKLLV